VPVRSAGVEMSDKDTNEQKFVQITTAVYGSEILLYALDQTGGVWRFDDKTRQWVKLSGDRR
jgi:hypothetical protein